MLRRSKRLNNENKPPNSTSKRLNNIEPKDNKRVKTCVSEFRPQFQSSPKRKLLRASFKKDIFSRRPNQEKGWRPNQTVKRESSLLKLKSSLSESLDLSLSSDSESDESQTDESKCHKLSNDFEDSAIFSLSSSVSTNSPIDSILSDSTNSNRSVNNRHQSLAWNDVKYDNEVTDSVDKPIKKYETKESKHESCVHSNTLQDFLAEVSVDHEFEDNVTDILLEIGENFIAQTASLASKLAKLRTGNAITVSDVGLALDRRWNMKFPESGDDKRRITTHIPFI